MGLAAAFQAEKEVASQKKLGTTGLKALLMWMKRRITITIKFV